MGFQSRVLALQLVGPIKNTWNPKQLNVQEKVQKYSEPSKESKAKPPAVEMEKNQHDSYTRKEEQTPLQMALDEASYFPVSVAGFYSIPMKLEYTNENLPMKKNQGIRDKFWKK